MRISDSIAGSTLDATGAEILTSTVVLATDTNRRAPGPMSDQPDWYGQFPQDGGAATWSVLGPFPQQAVSLFSDREVTIAYPDPDSGAPSELRVWGRWPLVLQPSVREGTEPDPGVVLPWITEVVDTATSGLFPVPTDLFPKQRLDSGCLWTMAAGAITVMDFCTDIATRYQQSAGSLYAGGLWPPESIPEDPWGPDEETLAIPVGSFRALDTWRDLEASYVAVAGSTGVAVLRKDFAFGGVPHQVVEVQTPEDFTPYDVKWNRNGGLIVSGTTSAGIAAIQLRAPITGPGGWGSPEELTTGLDIFGPKLTLTDDNVWFYGGQGHVFRFEAAPEAMSGGVPQRYVAGPRRILSGVRTSEPDFETIDTGSMILGLQFERDLPWVLMAMTAQQGGGTMLTNYGRNFRTALWRRYYTGLQTQLLNSDLVTPGSPLVEPGITPDPVVTYGPDDTEAPT